MTAAIIIVAALALGAGIIYAVRRAETKRREALATVAATLGFRFTPGDVALPAGSFPFYERGHSQRAYNLLQGESAGQPVSLFDYRYTTSGGRNQTTLHQTVVVFHKGAEGLPDFELSPENLFHKIGQVFGYQDIDFEDDPEFSTAYLLRGRDEAAIQNLFTRTVRAFLSQHPGWTVQVRGGSVLLCRAARRVNPEDIPTFLADSLSIVSGLGARG